MSGPASFEAFLENLALETLIFMQEDAPCHKGRSAMDFQESYGIKTLPWLSNSRDVNPTVNSIKPLKSKMHDETRISKESHNWGTYFGVGAQGSCMWCL